MGFILALSQVAVQKSLLSMTKYCLWAGLLSASQPTSHHKQQKS